MPFVKEKLLNNCLGRLQLPCSSHLALEN